MDYGAHLPLIALDRQPWTLHRLLEYAQIAESVCFHALSANDHLVFPRPWLDGPTALAAVLSRTGRVVLATTVVLPVVRGPVALAKTFPGAEHITNTSSTHYIQLDNPQLVTDSIRQVVDADRDGAETVGVVEGAERT